MSSRSPFVSLLTAFLLAVGLLAIAPAINDASAESGGNRYVLEKKRRGRAPQIPLPIGPSFIYYDYPYYYARGYYPRHIVRYVYYPAYWQSRYPGHRSRCAAWRQNCVASSAGNRGPASRRRRAH